MSSSESFQKFSQAIDEALNKFYSSYQNDPELNNEERIRQLVNTIHFDMEQGEDEIVQAILNKNFHALLVEDNLIKKKIFPYWERFLSASTAKTTTSKIGLTVGDESPEIKKTHLNLEIVSDTIKQKELLTKHLSTINPDVEIPFVAVKLYSSNPKDVESFLNEMLPMAVGMIQSLPIPVKPELSVVSGDDHLILQATVKKSLEANFMTILFGHLLSKLPEYDVELRLNLQTGTNFKHLIDNHTDNTVFDLLNGFKIFLELKNNLAGFVDEVVKKLQEKEKFKQVTQASLVSFVLGSLSLTSELNLNLGANEVALMSQLPKINIFDKEGILSQTPVSTVKAMRDENEMVGPILSVLNTLEGRGELFVSTPFFTVHADVDVTGVLDLVNSTIDLFGA